VFSRPDAIMRHKRDVACEDCNGGVVTNGKAKKVKKRRVKSETDDSEEEESE
jgi:hypothetical protein